MAKRNAWGGLCVVALMACGDNGAGGSLTEDGTGTTRGTADTGETTTDTTPTTSATGSGVVTDPGSGTGTGGVSDATTSPPTTGQATTGTDTTGTDTGSEASSTGAVASTVDVTGDATTGDATTAGMTTAGMTTGTTGSGTMGEETSGEETGEADFCAGNGGILLPGDDICTGDLGEKTFTFALCSCTNFTTAGVFTVDAFNSDANKPQPVNGGSVGINGNYTTVALAGIGGALWVDGKVSTVAIHDVGETLQCGGDVSATVVSHVNEDAYVEGNIGGILPLMTIDGDLHMPANKVNGGALVLGQTIKGPVNVETPCDCNNPIDVDKIVQGYEQDNDNAAAGIDEDLLDDVILPLQIELPCGVYFFSDIQHLLALKIVLTGRTVIAVDGDLTSIGLLDLELGPDAELDLFIAGDASFADLATLGDTKRPAAFRMYVGGQVTFASLFTFGGNLYQPNAVFNAAGLSSIWGSLYVGGINLVGAFAIHYDEAILDIEGCGEPGGGCIDGDDCGNPTPACIEGTCVPCQVDADCGPPLTCQEGGVCYPIPG